jgi:tRNA (cytidine/uridine-2'-O-)-methyltransferase
MFRLSVVLFEPRIPQNTGNIARTCAAVGADLHLIEPLGFRVNDRNLKRAGLDYWHLVKVRYHAGIQEFLSSFPEGNHVFITKKALRSYEAADFSGHVFLVFGKETEGLPQEILDAHRDKCFRIPMREDARSLNLSSAAAVVAYEALRQNGFEGLQIEGAGDFD